MSFAKLALGAGLGALLFTVAGGACNSPNVGGPDPRAPVLVTIEHAAVKAPSPAAVEPETTTTTATVPGGMARIAGGTFEMGSDYYDDEKPIHSVTVRAFEMDLTEVTTAAYGACVSAGQCTTVELASSTYCNWGKTDRQNDPLNCVDWNQAVAYCDWAGKRLPTEEEWERAARGADGRPWPWGNEPPSTQLCWNRLHTKEGTCAAGSHPATAFGLFDMAGNVAEWTSTRYCPYAPGPCSNEERVFRGGAWNDGYAPMVRGAFRDKIWRRSRGNILGFRCARGT